MALPPTRLTVLLSSTPLEPSNLTATLERHGLLSPSALADRQALTRCLALAIEEAEARPLMPGPTTADVLANRLRTAGYLSPAGLQWFQSPPGHQQLPRGGGILLVFASIGLRPLLQGLLALVDPAPLSSPRSLDLAFGSATLGVMGIVWSRHSARRTILVIYGAIGIGWCLAAAFSDPAPARPVSTVLAFTTAALIAMTVWLGARQLATPDRTG